MQNCNNSGCVMRPWSLLLFFCCCCCFPGIPIRSSLDGVATAQYARLLRKLTVMARSAVRDIDPQNDLTFLRLRSQKREIMVGLGKCYRYIGFADFMMTTNSD